MPGAAAILLHNGRTQHSQCKVSLDIKVECTCNCSKRDATGKLMQSAHLFLLIDEVSTGHGHISESVDWSLQDMRKNKTHFGGLTILLFGDWKQILSVIHHSSCPQCVKVTLKEAHLCHLVRTTATDPEHEWHQSR